MIAVIDYGAGNLRNVCKALEHVGASFVLTDDVSELRRADKLVLPGVGAFADCLNGLHSRQLFDPIRQMALAGKPLLGICVGMQLLFDVGEEMGQWPGLGLIGGRVVKFDFSRLATEVAPGEPAAERPPARTHERIGADQHSVETPTAQAHERIGADQHSVETLPARTHERIGADQHSVETPTAQAHERIGADQHSVETLPAQAHERVGKDEHSVETLTARAHERIGADQHSVETLPAQAHERVGTVQHSVENPPAQAHERIGADQHSVETPTAQAPERVGKDEHSVETLTARAHERVGEGRRSAESPPAAISIARSLKIPHIGWNNITPSAAHPIFTGIERGGYAYFVHSFHALVANSAHGVGLTQYGYDFASVVAKDNIWGVQFHPEKSQEIGLAMLRNFANHS